MPSRSCSTSTNPDDLIETVVRIAPTFGGINLEDIAAPAAFYVESELKRRLDIPVFHDDQHGTAVVALAALQNAAEVVGKPLEEMTVVVSGIGAAGLAIAKILLHAGVSSMIGTDRQGAIHDGREGLNDAKQWFAEHTNSQKQVGAPSPRCSSAPTSSSVSAVPASSGPRTSPGWRPDAIVFAMANPDPEIRPEDVEGLVSVMATGRSDYPNQINNVLAFPGIFRGAFDAHATDITEGMKLAAAQAIAAAVDPDERSAEYVIPSVFDKSVPVAVAAAVAEAARADGVARS